MQNYTEFEPNYSDFYYRGHPEMSEDCLYLNVTTGAVSPDEKRPVYIWFHGGGLFNGYSYIYIFDPSELARKGVVVVSVGHRLNLFGYMALPQLSAEQGGKSGNYGLMDEFKALDWVSENIAAFGGDRTTSRWAVSPAGPGRAERSRPRPTPAAGSGA
jgi:para-nitrobenzyl esterase